MPYEDLEEELEEPLEEPEQMVRYQHPESGHIFEFQKFPNFGKYRKFQNKLIMNYVMAAVRLGPDVIYRNDMTPKQMERVISKNKLKKLED